MIHHIQLLRIISEQRRWEEKGGLSAFDPNCTIFVCNKWDIVEKRGDIENTWKDTVNKLQTNFHHISEEHIFKMSTTEVNILYLFQLMYQNKR